uniref:Vitamin K epoxide reductase domain-containing protein n=1 Tax=Ditylum brightwellii TaxID=49249 RepID=A0A7S4VPD6_9STRA|mmetsp:Transcript_21892/g.32550  ORF Transcript_21892/g.32550 Transcript_21892/m.32550 type:complete len:413 (+) Transcript_21892:79-1317(+)
MMCFKHHLLVLWMSASSIATSAFNPSSPSLLSPRPLPQQRQLLVPPLQKNNQQNVLFSRISDENSDESMNGNNGDSVWNPSLRKTMGTLSTLGALETGFLTYVKLFSDSADLCGTNGGCGSVLNSPYATIHLGEGLDVPLAALGFLAYSTVAVLSLTPVLASSSSQEGNDGEDWNRIGLLALTTSMATFSVFCMSFIYGVLHTSCTYCLSSAILSITLGILSWTGGVLPATSVDNNESNDPKMRVLGLQTSLGGFALTTIMALVLFTGVDETALASYGGDGSGNTFGSTLLASTSSTNTKELVLKIPPPITTTSSPRALSLATDLQKLNAKMYGAYWCSHCYEQKQKFGLEAMRQYVPYVECDREGINSQGKLCKAMDIPGYPTWEIDGKLYPGEQELDELEDIVKEIMSKK